ncbi:MAG: peptide chain release factor N(5)-glutamine methyltransferase [Candidatus Promineifilaceae bacterium]
MIIQEALAFGRQQLTHSSNPTLDARLLLEFVLGKSHSYLAAYREQPLSPNQEESYQQLIQRAAQAEPIPYLTGQAPFFGRLFRVTPAVLIPRPETEQLVERALKWGAAHPQPVVIDVGTGSGCIAITLALSLPAATIEATDISEAALVVARQNAASYQVAGRISFHQGNLLEPVVHTPNLIAANLPYITDEEWPSLPDGVKSYEPESALRGGPDGLDYFRQLLSQAKEKMSPGGAIFLEIGWKQGSAVKQLGQSFFPDAQVDLLADYAGKDRIVTITGH